MQTKNSQGSQDLEIRPELPQEIRREILEASFPEIQHISDSSSREEREIAFEKLLKRLGIPFRPLTRGV